MNLNKVDLNLFIVFDVIYIEVNLICVGQIVGIIQLVVFNVFFWLCEIFNDLLFVCIVQGMVLILMVQNIIGLVCNVLQLLWVLVQESCSFDLQQVNKIYCISMIDFIEVVIFFLLFQCLCCLVLNVYIESFFVKCCEIIKEFVVGCFDFVVDVLLNIDFQVCYVKLMEDCYVCVMCCGYLLVGKLKLVLDDYLGLIYIYIFSCCSGFGYIDLVLGKMGIQCKIVLCLQYYLMVFMVVQQIDMVMIVLECFVCYYDLYYVVLLVSDVLKLEIYLYWYESIDQDLVNCWMCEQIIELCQQVIVCENKVVQLV